MHARLCAGRPRHLSIPSGNASAPLSITDSHGDHDRPDPHVHHPLAHPVRTAETVARRADGPRLDPRRAARARVRGVECVPRAQDRPDGVRLDSDRGALGGLLPDARPLDDPGEQHRPDHRVGRRIHRRRDRVHPSRHSAHGLRPEHRQGRDRGRGGRRDGDPAHDSAAPSADREGARPAHLPRGHRLCRSAGRRGAGRPSGAAAVPGVRNRLRIQVPDVGAQGVEGISRLGVERLQGRIHLRRGVARTAGRRVHHRTAHRRLPVLGRLLSPIWCSSRRSSCSAAA